MSKPAADLLALSMIVKDEAKTIERTLRSVKPYVDRWIIADTGSTDETRDVVRRAMKGVPGEVVEIPFTDFSTTRNAALDRCGKAAEFILWLDAEDVLDGGPALRAFLAREAQRREPDREAYYLRVESGIRWSSARVFRSRAGWRFKGAVHEVLVHPDRPPPVHRVPDVLVRHDRTGESAERTRRRWERDLVLLEGALGKDPADTRSAFYLAQTLSCLDRKEEAIAAYRRRAAMGGWNEEVYQSRMSIADLTAAIRPWNEALPLYLEAHATAPHRAEPLHAVALHYNAEAQHALALIFARRGADLALPVDDQLFVDEEVYRWKLADLVGSSAYWVGEYEMGEAAARAALRHRPDDPRLQKNLGYYLDRKKTPKKAR
jgi:tetratricopeptide (TPR) repeat protein